MSPETLSIPCPQEDYLGHCLFHLVLLQVLLVEAETKAKNMEEEICRLQKTLEERNGQLEA
ncbi:hypothetical protein Patl1_00384 [Pistacia atlantica]|uniref:Uncharacterized protein n=1 Tax=Pistacia atlantica TaxID=434234 RepID=A0ACC1C450_9ROSI|nr:hypothetical protein Patl1_00384 [Pistacia atlantica]